ncbi:sulfite exporter TauE/SafE family protein [Roseovarius spongiae]|uniref:Probable membrane transporter protein n=1 Tax=Roseovarius spongiae TaxID=2320272 RepID=A0A3A8AT11_9RHOB|nr:sulfite exporter TauE/SafE family protein [Roseovarius spongiae]RKF13619.1 sulfite exporter TauE/SafE family protein [Roseovarius spongiae]
MADLALLVVAGFAAGVLNAIAGGGTFLTLPALIFVGIPPVAANATATLSALPGYLSSAWGFRRDLRAEGRLSLRGIVIASGIGSLAGAALLLLTSDAVFSGIVPWLLLLATALFAAGPALIRRLRARGLPDAGPVLSFVVLVAVSIYGGYFNGGLGIMLLAAFGLLGYSDLHAMNGLKNALSVILSLIPVLAFIPAGVIAWEAAAPVALAATAGGLMGAGLSRRIANPNHLRIFIVLVGLVMSVLFFLR